MITIRNGSSQITVTRSAYANYYRHLGYEPVDGVQSGENPAGVVTTPHVDYPGVGPSAASGADNPGEGEPVPVGYTSPEDEKPKDADEEAEDEAVDLSEIPLSEMSLSQLYEYAEQLGLDFDGITTKKAMRALIREHLE